MIEVLGCLVDVNPISIVAVSGFYVLLDTPERPSAWGTGESVSPCSVNSGHETGFLRMTMKPSRGGLHMLDCLFGPIGRRVRI